MAHPFFRMLGDRVGRWVAALLLLGLGVPAWADDPLVRWRADATAVRQLAENDAPAALNQARLLQQRLPAEATPEDRVQNLNLQARVESHMGDVELSMRHVAQAVELARAHGLAEGEAEAHLTNVLNHINRGHIPSATEATEQALTLLQGSKNPVLRSEAMLRAASMYIRMGQVNDAITPSLQLLEMAQHSKNPLALAYAHLGLATIYKESNREAEGLEHYALMQEHARRANSGMLMAHGLLGQAAMLQAQGDIDGAERTVREAIARFRSVGMPFYTAHSLYGLAEVQRARKDHTGALQTLNEVAAIFQQHPNKLGQWWMHFARSQEHLAMGQLPLALADARQSRAIADEIGLTYHLTESTWRLSEVEAALGHYQAAYNLIVQAQAYAKKLEKERLGTRLSDLSKRFQQESRQREIDRLTRENEVQANWQRWLLTLLVAATLLLGLSFYHLKKMRDINRRTAALNTELQQSRNRLQAILDALPDLVFEMDADGRYLGCYTREHVLLVSPVSDLLGRTVTDVLPPHVSAVAMQALRQAQQHGTSTGWQYPLQLPQGVCWFHLFVAKIKPNHGNGDERFIVVVRDITAQKQAEAAQQESERRYRQIFESVSDALYLMEITHEGRIRNLEFNPAFEMSAGLSRHDLIGRYMDETFSPEAARVTEAEIRSCLATGQRHDETITLTLVGGTRHLHATLIPVRDESGRIHRVVGIRRDITDQERAKQLMLSQIELDSRLAHFAELAPGFMFTYQQSSLGERGVFLYASQGVKEVCGFTAEELLADPRIFFLHIATEQTPDVWDAMNHAAQARESSLIEFQIKHPTKGDRWLELRATPETDGAGKVLWHGHVMDSSARKAIESRLQASERAFRTLAENFPDAIGRFDLQGRLAYINPKVARLMDRLPASELSKRPTELDLRCEHPPTTEIERHVDQVIETGEPCEHEVQWSTEQGEHIFEIRHIPEKDHSGQLVSVMTVGRNITRQKHAEHALKQSRDELRHLSAHLNDVREQERKRIAREIHDELGQMLTALKLDLGTFRLQFGAVNAVIDQRSQRLIAVVEDTIQVVRTIATALRPASLDMGLVPAVEWLVAEFRKRSDVVCALHLETVDIQLEDAQSTAVFRMLQEALTNVTRHAHAKRVDIFIESDDHHLMLRVSDDGLGFDAGTRKTQSFGLVGIHERALILGGFANIRSSPGHGTTVEVRIPRALKERQLSHDG